MSARIGVAVNGAGGKMGRKMVAAVLEAPDLALTAALEAAGHPLLGQDAGTLAGVAPAGVALASSLASARPAVVVDFSAPAAVPALARACESAGVALLVCTTGLVETQVAALRSASSKIPVLLSPNMSLGVNVLFGLVRQVARCLGDAYDIEIVEMHHRLKKDAPSGTALRLAESAAAGLGRPLSELAIHGRSGLGPERPRAQIGIHAVRGGDVTGDHTVIFAGPGERIELAHKASSRDVFVSGALRAARWLAGKPAGWYTMDAVLGLAAF